jgi:hypothetical protein
VGQHLAEVFRFFRFTVPEDAVLAWQYTRDVNYEQPGIIRPAVESWLHTTPGRSALAQFGSAMLAAGA